MKEKSFFDYGRMRPFSGICGISASMYIPPYASLSDPDLAYELMRDEPFATLITTGSGADAGNLEVNHYPFHLERGLGEKGVLWTHLARSNPQSRALVDGETCLVSFQGPNAYISPRHYASELNVPTWNYAAVQARCRISRVDDAEGIDRILHALVDRFEAEEGLEGAWKYVLPEEFKVGLIRGIMGVRLEILEIEGKYKLSQNREREDYEPVLAYFSGRQDDRGRALYRYMLRARSPESGG